MHVTVPYNIVSNSISKRQRQKFISLNTNIEEEKTKEKTIWLQISHLVRV